MIRKLASLGIFIIFAFYITVFLGAVTGATEGFIKDAQTGKAIPNAKIILVYAKSESMKYELYSDEKGHFYKGGLSTGFYNVTVEKDGYLPKAGSIRIKLGEVFRLEIELKSFEGMVPQSSKLSDQGSKLINAGKYDQAIEIFTEAISEDQSNPVFYYYRGVALDKSGKIEEALEDYLKSIELKPDFILPFSRIGNIYAKQRDFEKAIEFYKQAVELGDQNTFTHYNFGACLINLGNRKEAKDIFERLLSLDENYSDAYYQLGIIYTGLGEAAKAKEFLQKFIDMDPENKNAAIAKGILKSLNLPLTILL